MYLIGEAKRMKKLLNQQMINRGKQMKQKFQEKSSVEV